MERSRRLVLVTPDATDATALERLENLLPALQGIVDVVILRWSSGEAAAACDAAARLRGRCPALQLLLRDRVDVARAAGLHGVQLSEAGFAPADVRRVWPEAVIGVSRHDVDGVRTRSRGADFALVAPVHVTPSKPGHPGLGLDELARIAEASPVEVVALGGLNAAAVPRVLASGVAGIAVRSAVFEADDPVAAARGLRDAIDSAG